MGAQRVELQPKATAIRRRLTTELYRTSGRALAPPSAAVVALETAALHAPSDVLAYI